MAEADLVDSNLDPVLGFVRIYSRSVRVYETQIRVKTMLPPLGGDNKMLSIKLDKFKDKTR